VNRERLVWKSHANAAELMAAQTACENIMAELAEVPGGK
jgi:hypothetical protein